MNEKAYRALGQKPFCRCCGSRDVVTLEKVLKNSPASKWTASAKRAELWRCIDDLGLSGIWKFVDDAFGFMLIEDIGDLQTELEQQLIEVCAGMRSSTKLDLPEAKSNIPVDLANIGQDPCSGLVSERKHGFLRIWNSFSREDKISFLRYVKDKRPYGTGINSPNPSEDMIENPENRGYHDPKQIHETPSNQATKKDGKQ